MQIFIIRKWQAFHQSEQRYQVTKNSARLAANEFCRIRILFLRHDATACCKRIGKFEKSEFTGIPYNDFFTKSTEMHHDQRRSAAKLYRKISIRNSIHTVMRNFREPQKFCRYLSIYGKVCTCQSSRTQGHNIDSLISIYKTFFIAKHHFYIGQ